MLAHCPYNLRLTIIFYLALFSLTEKYAYAAEEIMCGKVLNDVLASLCVNGFNLRFKRCLAQENQTPKTSASDESWFNRIKEILKTTESNASNLEIFEIDHSTNNEHKILIRKRKQVFKVSPRGVADECCKNGCVYADIIAYCN